MICFITVTLKLRSKCSFNIKSSQTGRGHIPAEQYQMGKANRKSRQQVKRSGHEANNQKTRTTGNGQEHDTAGLETEKALSTVCR